MLRPKTFEDQVGSGGEIPHGAADQSPHPRWPKRRCVRRCARPCRSTRRRVARTHRRGRPLGFGYLVWPGPASDPVRTGRPWSVRRRARTPRPRCASHGGRRTSSTTNRRRCRARRAGDARERPASRECRASQRRTDERADPFRMSGSEWRARPTRLRCCQTALRGRHSPASRIACTSSSRSSTDNDCADGSDKPLPRLSHTMNPNRPRKRLDEFRVEVARFVHRVDVAHRPSGRPR